VHATLPSNVLTPPREIVHGGNWIRITYAHPVSAARAVGTIGQLIGGAYMNGVIYAPKAAANGPTAEEV
jgi:Nup53/35/40-type RNA recognition motif